MATDIAIIVGNSYLAALGLKTLLLDMAPSLSVSLFYDSSDISSQLDEESVVFSFNEQQPAITINPSWTEAQLKKTLKAAIKKILQSKEKEKRTIPSGNRKLSAREIDVLRLVASGFNN